MKVLNPTPLSIVPPSSSVHEKTPSSSEGLPPVVIKVHHKENNPHFLSSTESDNPLNYEVKVFSSMAKKFKKLHVESIVDDVVIEESVREEKEGDQLQPLDQSTDHPSTIENPDESGVHMATDPSINIIKQNTLVVHKEPVDNVVVPRDKSREETITIKHETQLPIKGSLEDLRTKSISEKQTTNFDDEDDLPGLKLGNYKGGHSESELDGSDFLDPKKEQEKELFGVIQTLPTDLFQRLFDFLKLISPTTP
ncbi:hypothetical protein Sjap_005054 [Stephania japonica]|uniref:Uncharacterized protein n=1 Tax=Stephania japonica TaxID=461633 RepID=A0AAP0PLH0_9MAGN